MKPILFSLVFLVFSSPLFADYGSMKDDWAAYLPPESFRIMTAQDLEKPAGRQEVPSTPDKGSIDPVKAQIKALSGISQALAVEAGQDKKTLSRVSAISSDDSSVKNLLSREIRLEEIIILAALRNPGILAAQKKVKAELKSFDQVMGLDDNLRQYSAFTKALAPKAGPLKNKDSVKLSYPYPGVTALKGEIVRNQVSIVSEKMKITARQVETDIEKAYWDLVFVEESIRITRETIDAFDRLGEVAATLYKAAKTSFQDVIKINIKTEELKENLVTLAARKKNIEIRILELLSLPADTSMGRVVIVPPAMGVPGPETLFPIARENRQELRVLRFRISKLEAMVEMAETMTEEDFTLGFSQWENEMAKAIDRSKPAFPEKTMAAMGNSHPVKPWYGVDKPWLNQTRLTLSSLRQTLVNRENATDRMVRNAWFKLDRTHREYKLNKNRILPLSRSAMDVASREYEAGSIPFSQAIDSYTSWLGVKLTIAQKQAGLGAAFADLENITGKKIQMGKK